MLSLGGALSVQEVVAVAREHEPVELDGSAADAMRQSRQVVRDLVDGDRRVYGINTGYGEMKDVAIPRSELQTQQLNLLRSHNVTVGSPFPQEVVRAAILIRANVLAQGYSGVREELVEALIALLNSGVHPVLRKGGSTDNAAGLANVGLVLAGAGEASLEGETVSGSTALERAGLEPLTLQPKEGLALISGTATMTALLALGVNDAARLIDTADMSGAWVFELIGKQPGAFDPDVAAVHPQPGQETSAANVRALIGNGAVSTHMSQDPLSIRCIPQIHGAARQFLGIAKETVETELGSVTDNPLVFPDGRVLSNGNFNGQHLATAADALGGVMLNLGRASEQRFARLLEGGEGIPVQLTERSGPEMGLSRLQYAAASLITEAASSGSPSGQSLVTAAGQEDIHAVGNIAGMELRDLIERVRYVVAMELLGAARATSFESSVSDPIDRLAERFTAAVDVPDGDASWSPRVETAVQYLQSPAHTDNITELLPAEGSSTP